MKESTKEILNNSTYTPSELAAEVIEEWMARSLRAVSELIIKHSDNPECHASASCAMMQLSYEMAGLEVPKDIMDKFEEIMDEGKL